MFLHTLSFTLFNPSLDEFFHTTYPLSSVFTEVSPTAIATQYPSNKQNLDLIVGSCHGIICFDLDRGFTLLWNPSIRKFSELPSSLDDPHRLRAHVTYGFGYDYFSGAFKVVSFSGYSSGSLDGKVFKVKVKVHTVGAKTWRRIPDVPYGVPIDESGKFVCGSVNWLTRYDSDYVIVSLDLEKESYRKLFLPYYGEVVVVKSTLEVLKNCLCTLAFAHTFSDVWLLKEFGNDEFWIKLFRLPSMEDFYGFCFYERLLYVFEDGKVLLQFQSELVVYNPIDGTLKTLQHMTYLWCFRSLP